MNTYQTVLILKPDLDDAQVDEAIKKITGFISKNGSGEITRIDKWGKKRLSYKVKKHRFGIYLNIIHTCEGIKIPSVENEFKLFDAIIKFLVIRLEERDLSHIMKDKSLDEDSKATESTEEKSEEKAEEKTTASVEEDKD
ncbi:MAG: 30S ribosomal protein S6 [Nitrospinales bacterium]